VENDAHFIQIGYEGMVMVTTIIIADITSLRSRLFCFYIMISPLLVSSHGSPCVLDRLVNLLILADKPMGGG